MNSRIFSIILFITIVAGTAHANVIPEKEFVRRYYPRLEQVLTHVSKTIYGYCDACMYGIAKMPEGYYLTIEALENNPNRELKYIQVWDRNTVDFVEFDVSEFQSEERLFDVPEEFRALYNQAEYYDFYLYYGYKNWTNDSRELINKSIVKSAEDLEILARAAAVEAVAYIRPGMTGDAFDFSINLEDKGFGKTSNVQREGFERKSEEALKYWKKIKATYPDHEPLIIKDLDLKIGNEYMHFYLLAESIGEDRIANTFFKNAYFNQAWIQYAKNMLNACEKDGILFTAGDSDTYPLMYVQDKLGYRTDVIIINTSLLNTVWYWEMIRSNTDIKPLIGTKEHKALLEKPVYVDQNALAAPFRQWLEKTLKSGDTLTYRLVPSDIILSYRETNISLEPKKMMLQPSDLIILDILDNTKQPVFTSAPFSMVNLGLYYNLATTGRAFSIVADRQEVMESIATVENIEDLAFYMSPEYLSALGDNAVGEVSILSYLVLNISPVFQERKNALIEKVYKQLPPESMVKSENFPLLDALNSFYEVLKPEASEELRNSLKPIAEDKIVNTTSLSKELSENLSDLQAIFSIYAHFRPHETPEYDIELDEVDKEILQQLKTKTEQLAESPVIKERAWDRRVVFELMRAFELLSLE